jgi:HK97 gp10 family phage protein
VTQVKLEGFSELEAKLKEFPENIARNAVRRAMVTAGNIMAEEQRAFAAESGRLAATIIVKAKTVNTSGFGEYAAVLREGGGYKNAQQALREARRGGANGQGRIVITVGSTAPHARLVEFGTVQRFHKSGKSTGIMPMNPFIRPAWDATAPGVVHQIKSILADEIERTAARPAGKKAKASGVA